MQWTEWRTDQHTACEFDGHDTIGHEHVIEGGVAAEAKLEDEHDNIDQQQAKHDPREGTTNAGVVPEGNHGRTTESRRRGRGEGMGRPLCKLVTFGSHPVWSLTVS